MFELQVVCARCGEMLSRMVTRIIFCLLLVVGFVACVEDFVPPSELGDHIRVLSIRTEPPQSYPGDEVDMQALVYVPDSAESVADTLWLACVPSVGEGAQTCLAVLLADVFRMAGGCEERCATDPDPQSCMEFCVAEQFMDFLCDSSKDQKGCVVGTGVELTYEVPETVRGSLGADDAKTVYLFLMATALEGGLSSCFQIWGDQVAQGNTVSPTEDCILSLKELSVLDESKDLAQNPTAEGLLLNDYSLAPPPEVTEVLLHGTDLESNELVFEGVFSLNGADNGYISWFSDCGKLDSSKTFFENKVNKLKPTKTGKCSIYAVVRDDIAGQSWVHRDLDLKMPD